MFTKKIVGVASAVLVALGVAAGPASADTLQYADDHSTVVAGADVEANLVSSVATLVFGGFTVECDQSVVTGEVSENPGDSGAGSLQGALTTGDDVEWGNLVISFSDTDPRCDDDISFYNVAGADGTAAFAGVDADNSDFTLYNLSVDLHLRDFGSLECTFTGAMTGDVVGSNLVFVQVPMSSSSGFPCPGSATFTAEYELSETGTGRLFELVN